jgi:serine kinase of HPr protein (carbohydrate metabolism regulator)
VSEAVNIHATGLVLGGSGVILRGPSGAGKSLLALELIDQWQLRGLGAELVSDDRVDVLVERGRLTIRPPRVIAGLIELRGRGIVTRPHARRARLDLVVDLVDRLDRMIEEEDLVTELLGIRVVRCPVPRAGIVDSLHQLLLIREALFTLTASRPVSRQETT